MRCVKCVTIVLAMVSLFSVASGQTFWEDFESYPTGQIVGQGGWEGWGGDAAAGAPVSSKHAFSGTKSIEIVGSADLVHTFDKSGGKWIFTAMQYIPSGTTGETYFILLNQYGGTNDWSVQTTFNLATGVITTFDAATGKATILYDQWVELKCEINLDENTVIEYYNGIQIRSGQWDDGSSGLIGAIDLYGNGASSIYYDDIKLQSYRMSLTPAGDPNPASTANDVPRDGLLTWTPGVFSVTHNVYFDTDYEVVANATVPTASNLQVNSFDPGRLEFGQTYYWRVDEVNGTPDKTVFKGDVWNFTSEPYAVQIPGSEVSISASSFSGQNDPNLLIDGSGMTGNAHSTADLTGWMSAVVDFQPVLVFKFSQAQALDTMRVYNSNAPLEAFIGMGAKDIVLETSMDGETWTVVEGVTSLTRAPGAENYNTPDNLALNGVKATQVRLQISSNWGGLPVGMGLSEVQFYSIPTYARLPVPTSGSVDVNPDATVTWRAGREAGEHTLYLSDDVNAVADASAPSVVSLTNSVDLGSFDLDLGTTYYWQVDEVNETEATPVWPGPMWSLTTSAALTVDDFESYNNLSPNRPFQTWLDGFGYSADDYFAVAYSGNGTGAGIGHDIWSPGSPFFGTQVMEQDSTLPGSGQSMPFYYTNTGGVASQTERTFAVPQNWAMHGIKTLSVAFRGQGGNTGTLFAMINNTKVTYTSPNGSFSGIGRSLWQTWNIDLASVSGLENVTKLTIGVEGSGASGMILIDDIRLVVEGTEDVISNDVTTPGDELKGVPDDGDWPAAESPDLAIDNNIATKYLHRKGGSIPTGFQVTPMVGATVVTGLTLTTANDVPNRDPVKYELYGSNTSLDGPYTLIASGNIVDFAGATAWPRRTQNTTPIQFNNTVAYKHYQLLFPTLRGATEALMQIAEVELISAQ